MPVTVNSIASGMTAAVTSAARTLPRNSNSTGDDEQRALEQVRRDRADGLVDEARAVVDGFELEARAAACG